MVDVERLLEVRGTRHDRLIERAEAHLYCACLDPGEVEYVAQTHAEPFGIAHRAVAPLRTGDTRLEQPTTVARALVHRRHFDPRQAEQLGEADR